MCRENGTKPKFLVSPPMRPSSACARAGGGMAVFACERRAADAAVAAALHDAICAAIAKDASPRKASALVAAVAAAVGCWRRPRPAGECAGLPLRYPPPPEASNSR